jgi:hypothetical protein
MIQRLHGRAHQELRLDRARQELRLDRARQDPFPATLLAASDPGRAPPNTARSRYQPEVGAPLATTRDARWGTGISPNLTTACDCHNRRRGRDGRGRRG